MKLRTTNRGFQIVEFKDRYGHDCSLQQSSLATEDAVWLGIDNANPQIMASQARRHGVITEATTGWVPYPIPEEVSLDTRMHLTRPEVEALVKQLNHWIATGEFRS
jgi:hypothetical protein